MSRKKPAKDREAQIARLVTEYEKRLRESYPAGPQTIEQIERSAQEIGEGVKQDIQQEKTESAGTGYTGRRMRCSCGAQAVHKGNPERLLVTLHGELVFRRASYWCRSCKRTFCPLDWQLGVPRGQVSVSVRALACRFASLLPFDKAARELELVCGVRLSASTLQRIAKQTGEELRCEWQRRQEQVWQADVEIATTAPARMYISMDGVMSHVGGAWHEVKLGTCYERGVRRPKKDHYCASLSASKEFGKQLKTMSVFAGEGRCRDVAVLADGSDWIWQESGKHFTRRTQILDFFHVTEHLWPIAHARFGQGTKAAEDWIHLQKGRLLEHKDGADEVIREIADWEPPDKRQRDLHRTTLGYLRTHKVRMSYKAFRDAGYHIGSGVMESSCRWVVQQRMKGPGMRWQPDGANAMLALRTTYCSSANDDLLNAARRSALAA
jgi:hypothetical protein